MARRKGRAPGGGRVSLSVEIRHQRGDFTLDVAFEGGTGVTALIGRSGAGKTTVAQAISGLLEPQEARISVGGTVLSDTAKGVHLPAYARRVGVVFQDARLFPHMNVTENLLYGARRRGTLSAARAQLPEILRLLGLETLTARRTQGLSGGETQRVAIARALLSDPQLLVLDEPLAALDPARKADVLPYLERVSAEAKVPILYVTHAMEEVARLASTVVVLEAGRVHRAGAVTEVFSDPTAVPHADVGAVLHAVVLRQADDGLTELGVSGGTVYLPRLEAKIGAQVTVRISASEVMLSAERPGNISALNVLGGTVEAIHEGKGPGAIVTVRVGEDRVLARITQRSANALGLAPGRPIYAVVKSLAVAAQNVGTPFEIRGA